MPAHRRTRALLPTLVGVLLLGLVVLTLLSAAQNMLALHHATVCQTRLNEELRDTLDVRTRSADAVRVEQSDYLDAVTAAVELTDPDLRAATQQFRDAIRADAELRASRPIPQDTQCE